MRCPEKPTINQMIAILHDQPFVVSLDLSRNIKSFIRRSSNEGFSFISKVLPQLGKALDRALDGKTVFTLPTSFKRYKKSCFPHFLGSALRKIFDETGTLLDTPCYLTVRWLRTFLYYAYKIEVPFSEQKIQEFSEKFIATDTLIGSFPLVGDSCSERIRRLMREQLSSLQAGNSLPSFGPGISANCKRHEKWSRFVPPSVLRKTFGRPFFHQPDEYWLMESGILFLCGFVSAFLGIDLTFGEAFAPSKILFVPKDSRGPRVICCEDSRLMYAQKSLQKSLYQAVETSDRFGGRVNFTDQTINQVLTFDSDNATIDLKDASDRVSLDLVIDVFPQNLLEHMLACRSGYYSLPDGRVFQMEKFAPMGSALCFPVMALLAYTAVCANIYLHGGSVPHRQDKVFVYGDDIIVPNEYAAIAMDALRTVGFLVNEDKSFINSRFRESCGQDTLDQSTVTPIRKRKLEGKLQRVKYNGRVVFDDETGALPGLVSVYNSARELGYKNLANSIEESIYASYRYRMPYATSSSPYLGKIVPDECVHRYNEAEGFEVNGKLAALCVKDRDVFLKRDATSYHRLRRQLIHGGGVEPIHPERIGARTPYLQRVYLQKWGTSYA